MYHDYFDDSDASALRNPYQPEVPPPDERGRHRQRLRLLGLVGAGLSLVAPVAGGDAPDRVAAAAGRPGADIPPIPATEAT